MTYSFTEVRGVPVILIRFAGRVDYARLIEVLPELMREPRFAGGIPAVWDLREADLSGFDLAEMQKLAAYLKDLGGRDDARVAMVIGHDWERPLMELWSEFLGLAVRQSRKICFDLDEALHWAATGADV